MKLSIIVPIYNVAPYLRKCVDSLLVQDISDYEIILVDDGSTDNSGAIADEIANQPTPNPFLEEGEHTSFAKTWGAHTADSTQYGLLKENAKANRKNLTEAESVMWDMLKGNNLGYHFRRQHIILDYIVDFVCLEKGLVIELDGGYHNDPQQKAYDGYRTDHLQRLGYTELRFKNEELLCNPDDVIKKIKETLESLPSINSLPFREGQGVGSLPSLQAMGNGQWEMGEETNRQSPIANSLPALEEEQYAFKRNVQRVWYVGNVMIDTLLANRSRFRRPAVYDTLGLEEKQYVVMTMHRPANVDEQEHLKALMEQIITNVHGLPIIFPIHPRTAKLFYQLWGNEEQLAQLFPNLHIVDPMGYLEFNYLVERAKAVVTDSGGITEETTVMGVPCITLRDNTERPETCTVGTNMLIGTRPEAIKPALDKLFAGEWKKGAIPALWDGHTAERIVKILLENLA